MPKGEWRGRRTQLSWMRDVVVGSVLRSGSGVWRVVRAVSRYRNGDLRCVTFAIKHCSWTHRCYTIYGHTYLRMMGYRMVAVAPRKLRTKLDRRINVAIHEPCTQKSMTCCDVKGVA